MTTYHIHALSGDDLSRHIDALCEVLENCVSGGASVSFMHPALAGKIPPLLVKRGGQHHARRAHCAGAGHGNRQRGGEFSICNAAGSALGEIPALCAYAARKCDGYDIFYKFL